MGPKYVTINNANESELPEEFYSAPERRFRTPWVLCDLGLLRVHVTVIRPQPEESGNDFSLPLGEPKAATKQIVDIVPLLEEELR